MRCRRCWISPRRSISCSTLWMACSGYFCRTQVDAERASCRDPRTPHRPTHWTLQSPHISLLTENLPVYKRPSHPISVRVRITLPEHLRCARHCSKSPHTFVRSTLQPYATGTEIFPIFTGRKRRHREAKALAQSHTVIKWQHWDFNQVLLTPELTLLTPVAP